MPDWPHLRNAPISEALIDVRAELPPDVGIDELARFQDKLRGQYPNRRIRRRLQGRFYFGDPSSPKMEPVSDQPDGYLFTSADTRQVVQARLDGFTFSRLKPYENWDRLRDQARELWQVYREVARPQLVTRIAVRYINRCELPPSVTNLREWVLTGPAIAPSLPQRLAGFFVKLNTPFDHPQAQVNVTQTIEPGDFSRHIPLIFDIDVFRYDRIDPADARIWEQFEDLRSVKNRVFFESITDRAKELWE